MPKTATLVEVPALELFMNSSWLRIEAGGKTIFEDEEIEPTTLLELLGIPYTAHCYQWASPYDEEDGTQVTETVTYDEQGAPVRRVTWEE